MNAFRFTAQYATIFDVDHAHAYALGKIQIEKPGDQKNELENSNSTRTGFTRS
jgi:hypothetical protein